MSKTAVNCWMLALLLVSHAALADVNAYAAPVLEAENTSEPANGVTLPAKAGLKGKVAIPLDGSQLDGPQLEGPSDVPQDAEKQNAENRDIKKPSAAAPATSPVTSSTTSAMAAGAAAGKSSAKSSKRRVRRDAQDATAMGMVETLPVLLEIQNLKWDIAPDSPGSTKLKRIGMDKIFHEALAHSIPVRQAEAQIKDAEVRAKEIRDPGLLNLLNPVDTGALKKAAEFSTQAAQAHLQAVRQKALLDSARLYAELTRAFLEKYLSYQAIEQGKSQLRVEESRFQNGETTSFDVTQTQLALIDRYGKYLNADNVYRTVSMALSSQMGVAAETTFVPEDFVWQAGEASIPSLRVLPSDLSLEKARKAVQNRPDLQELGFKREMLSRLLKASSGLEREKKKADLRQLELESEKAQNGAELLAEKAFSDYLLAQKNSGLARQRYELGTRFVHQLRVSHDAGFSSAKDVLDGEIELAKARVAMIAAQLAYNVSQIQLVYEMGLLSEDVLSRPPALPPHTL